MRWYPWAGGLLWTVKANGTAAGGMGARGVDALGCARSRWRSRRGVGIRVLAYVIVGGAFLGDNALAMSSINTTPHAESSCVVTTREIRELVLTPALKAYEPRFGASLTASTRWLAVGAPMDHDDGNIPGSVHLYEVTPSSRSATQTHEIAHTDSPIGGDRFGISLALRFAETPEPELLVGCDQSDEILRDGGCVRMFRLENGELQVGSILFSPRPEPGEAFGHALAANADCIIVGAPRGDATVVQTDPNGEVRSTQVYDTGHAYIFSRSSQSGAWYVSATLDRETPEASAWFGRAVAASGDWIAIGAPGVDAVGEDASIPVVMSVGEVSVFHRTAQRTWKLHGIVRPTEAAQFASFGSTVAIEGDTLIVGAPGFTAAPSGSAEVAAVGAVFAYDMQDLEGATPQIITAPDGSKSAFFGLSVALSRGQLLVGSPGASDAGQSSGAAWRFARSGADEPFLPIARLTAQSAGEMFLLGSSTALLDHCAIVGRFHDEESGHPQGSAHLFMIDPIAITRTARLNSSIAESAADE